MIVVDTSALVAILLRESDDRSLVTRLSRDPERGVPASCYLECAMVLSRYARRRGELDDLLAAYSIDILPCDAAQARLAADAFERYRRGSGHPAGLNFGDCLAYAAARVKGAPLLFKGDDFAATDLVSAA